LRICFASRFPGSVRVFIASLPGLSGLHVTQKPLIRVGDSNLCPKTHHPQENTRGEVNKFKPAIYNYPQLTTTNYRSVIGFIRLWGVRLGLGYLLAVFMGVGTMGVWLAMSLSNLFSGLAMIPWILGGIGQGVF